MLNIFKPQAVHEFHLLIVGILEPKHVHFVENALGKMPDY